MPDTSGRFFYMWGPFVLYPSEGETGRKVPEIVRVRWAEEGELSSAEILEVWPIENIFRNLIVSAAQIRLEMVPNAATGRAAIDSHPTPKEVSDWLAQTNSLARRLPFGGGVREQVEAASRRVQELYSWPARFVAGTPVPGNVKIAEFRQTVLFWSLEELRRAINQSEPAYARYRHARSGGRVEYLSSIPAVGIWEEWLGRVLSFLPEAERPAFDDHAVTERIRRFRRRLKPGAEHQLMAEVLNDITRFGPFLPDGSLRSKAPHATPPK